MNTKKLIGMIIGVTLFAALIAGATFAYLTYTATVQNATKTITTRDFTFASPTGTNITTLRYVSTKTRNTFTAPGDYVELSLSKAADTPYASSVKLILKKPTNGFTLANALKYAVCRSSTASTCNNSASTAIPSSTSTADWVVVNGNVTTGTDEQVLWEDTATAIGTSTTGSPFKVTGAASTTYYVYFWVDPTVATTSAQIAQVSGKSLKGNIYFLATQGQ